MSSHQQHTQTNDTQLNCENSELHTLENELDQCRQENEQLRQLLRDFTEFRPTSELSVPTVTAIDTSSEIDTTMPVSSYWLRLQESERNFQDENRALKQVKINITCHIKDFCSS